ncbi:MAG TPA: class I SAM-dependent methyltransferase [Gaiellaceae bacterium]|nr:class I SAM-dependent methyltransferase [Gaiellaceae bacterium]
MSFPERIVPDQTTTGIVALHLKRYEFARPWCEGKEVLDVACGVGYGSAFLAQVAARVVGGDIDAEAIEYAQTRYATDNVEYVVVDATALPFDDATFDVVCAFETIEHVADRDAYLREVVRVLRADGTYLLSTPRVDVTDERPANPFHYVEYSRPDFEALLGRFFGRVELYGQRRLETRRHAVARKLDVLGLRRRFAFVRRAAVLTGTHPTTDVTLDDVAIDRANLEHASELFAVCRAPRA